MTLRATCKSILKNTLLKILEWAKRNRDYFRDLKSQYQKTLDEEKLLRKIRMEQKEREKQEKREKRGEV